MFLLVQINDCLNYDAPVAFAIADTWPEARKACVRLRNEYIAKGGQVTDTQIDAIYE